LKAVVVLSGGMDSTLSTFIAKQKNYEIIALHFNYHQRTQNKELKAFRKICDYLKIDNRYEIDLDFFSHIGANALTDKNIKVPTDGLKPGVPITYVPFRNGIFLSIASAIAEKENAKAIFIGVVEEDSSGYPDCTDSFISKMQSAINEGTKKQTDIELFTPLIHLKKEDIVKEALKLNVPLELTWSCYQNEDKACGVCDSCRLRLKGFEKAGVKDKIEYV
jgi:7-cyano-7-deazaguanine synthase